MNTYPHITHKLERKILAEALSASRYYLKIDVTERPPHYLLRIKDLCTPLVIINIWDCLPREIYYSVWDGDEIIHKVINPLSATANHPHP